MKSIRIQVQAFEHQKKKKKKHSDKHVLKERLHYPFGMCPTTSSPYVFSMLVQ